MTCGRCGAEFEGAAHYYGTYVTHAHDSYCVYIFQDRIATQCKRAKLAEQVVAKLLPPFNRPEGVYGQ